MTEFIYMVSALKLYFIPIVLKFNSFETLESGSCLYFPREDWFQIMHELHEIWCLDFIYNIILLTFQTKFRFFLIPGD